MITTNIRVFRSPAHDPIILIPMGKIVRIVNISHFKHRDSPPFPFDEQDLVPLTKQLKLDTTAGQDGGQGTNPANPEEEDVNDPTPIYPPMVPPRALFQDRPGWDVSAHKAQNVIPNLADIDHCEVTGGGSVIIGVGTKGTLFVWKRLSSTT